MPDHYCTIEDVNAYCPQAPFGPGSKPSSLLVEKFIESVAKEIDAVLGNTGYIVPVVTGTEALAILRETCAWGALGLAQTVRETAVTIATGDRSAPQSNIWTSMFKDRIKRLGNAQDPFELPDAPDNGDPLLKDGADVLRSHVQSDVDRFADDPVVTRDQVL